MFSKQQCFKNCKEMDKHNRPVIVETPIEGMTDQHQVSLKCFDQKTRKVYYKQATFHTRKCVPARQVINMSSDAYDYMTSDFCPEWFRVSGKNPQQVWDAMSPEERLRIHLDRTAKHFGGIVDEYQILDD